MTSSAARELITAGDNDNENLRASYTVKISKKQLETLDNVVKVVEAMRSQEADRVENQQLWGELMNNYSYTLGRLIENPQIFAIVDQNAPTDFKHAVEMLLWILQLASQEGYKDTLLKKMLAPYMKPTIGDSKPYNNVVRVDTLMQRLQELKPTALQIL